MKKLKIFMVMLTMAALLLPIAPSLLETATAAEITANDLGIQYGATTGLGNRDVRDTVASIIKVVLGLLGIIAVVIIIIGGFTWMTAGGNEEKVGEAKKWIFSGVIGLAIVLSAYALASWVISQLVKATTSTTTTITP